MPKISLARSLKAFVEAITVSDKSTTIVRKVIGDAFGIKEDSADMQFLLFVELDNFERLLKFVELSEIEAEAKAIYQRQIKNLSAIVKHPVLYSRYDNSAAAIITSNAHVLTYVNDALEVGVEVDGQIAEEAEKLSEQLQDALDYLNRTELPLSLRGVLYPQLSNLIFLLKNFRVVGIDRVWEAASANILTIHREAENIEKAPESGPLKRAAIGMSIFLTALTVVLGTLHEGSKHALGVLKNAKEGSDLIEKWRQESTPRIEHHRGGPIVEPDGRDV